jgi:hypothetical protein
MNAAKQKLEELMAADRDGRAVCYDDLVALHALMADRPVPDGHYDVPKVHGEFWAMAQGKADYVVPAFEVYHEKHGSMLAISTEEGAVYITREQAKVFFHLSEYPPFPYTNAIGEAGAQYHKRFESAHPLPALWRWPELWDAMHEAALS